jgi:hypothetical protein
MKSTRRSFVTGAAAASLAFTVLNGMAVPANAQVVTPEEARQIAEGAYIYGYSLITTDVTRVQMSNVPKVEGLTAPTGQFINIPRSAGRLSWRFSAKCGHALFSGLARPH